MKLIFKGAAIALALSASSLLAGTTSYSHMTPTQSAPFTDNFTLPYYTPTVGNTLIGITISLSFNTTGIENIYNSASSALAYTDAGTLTPLTLSAPASQSISTNAVTGPVSGTAAPMVVTMVPGLTGSGMPSLVVPMADWSFFEGTGTFSSSLVAGKTSYSGSGSDSLFFNGSSTVGATTTITYNYVATSDLPEPATMTLVGSALLGIGFFARRRIKKT